MIKAVISDMDGVILDSEKLYVRFWCEAAQSFGFPMQREHALGIRSMARPFAIAKLQGWFGASFDYDRVRDRRVALMDEYVSAHGIEAKPGAKELLEWLKANGYPVALATATPVARATEYLAQVGLLPYFDAICSARQVAHGKPEPDIYLYAAERLGVAPEACLALEDSPNGVRAASSAGCKTVLIPDLDDPSPSLKDLLYATATNLTDISHLLRL
ncbi:MAG: HAD family phosphatase [Ruminococcus sp.]|nr:HAD family phosphatase [Ruminococcus sp.]